MDMGCYPVSLLRLLAPGPRVINASAKLSSPGVDRAMDAHFSLPDGGRAHIGCSMFSSSILRMHVDVIGDNGKVSVFNPFSPQYGHRMKVTTTLGNRRERFSRKATYDFQLEAFVAAVEDGTSFPTTATDAIRTMELIDSIYLAAGLPARQPTPPQGHTTEPPTNGPLER
jgi:predicted dehydrogenase